MDDAEKSDARFSANAAYGVVGLNTLIWVFLIFYLARNVGIAGKPSLTLVAVPVSAISLMIVIPILLLRVGRPRIALAIAGLSLVAFAFTTIDVFFAAGI